MTIVVGGLLGPLLLTGGLASGAATITLPYVDPDAGTVIADPGPATSYVDPDAGTVINQ
jgi:hypothetical protein